jgi:hypothetical protein
MQYRTFASPLPRASAGTLALAAALAAGAAASPQASSDTPGPIAPSLEGVLSTPIAAEKVPSPLPFADPDGRKDPWLPPAKGAAVATGYDHLALGERIALDAGLNARRRSGSADPSKVAGEPSTPTLELARDARNHFQIDEPGDGRVWVFGGTYKASFGADGATYIPSFGATAPQNFPVTFRMDNVTSGGHAVPFTSAATPELNGTRVEFDRGAVRETYDVALGQVEQSFVFASLPSTGELVVELSVDSELRMEARGDGLTFAGELGRVDYSGAIAIDGDGRRLALETRRVEGELHLVVPAEFVASATLPLVIDPVITTWTVNNGATDDYQADIAYDASQNRFLVVFERAFSLTDSDVWGELFSPATGTAIPGSGAYIDFTGNSWRTPRCANNRIASQFLVVAEVSGTVSEIWGRTREAEDTTQGSQFQISSSGGSKQNPDVGGDPVTSGPTYYCVVWERVASFASDHDIHARLVRTDSSLLGASTILVDNSSASYDRAPTISKHDGLAPFGSQTWNIAWSRLFSTSDWDIRGAQILWDGTVVTPSFSVDFSALDHRSPEVSAPVEPTADGRPYAVVYEDYGAQVTVVARILAGDRSFAVGNLSALQGTPSNLADILPCVETDGTHFAVAWSQQYVPGSSDYDVYARGFYYTGSTLHLSDTQVNLAFSGTYEGNTRITALYGEGYTSTWFGAVWTDSAGVGDIEAATYSLPLGHGPFLGSAYCSPAVPNSTGVGARIEVQGSGNAGGQPLRLIAYQLPQNVSCYFLGSPVANAATTPASSGIVCVGNPLSRFNGPGQVGNSGSAGRVELDVDTLAIPLPAGGTLVLTSGTTYHFQAWYRDGATNNLSDARAVTFL